MTRGAREQELARSAPTPLAGFVEPAGVRLRSLVLPKRNENIEDHDQ